MPAPVLPRPYPHLRAAVIALGLLAGVALASLPVQDWIVHGRLADLTETPLVLKNQGEWVQRLTFAQSDVLPVYGSSEMRLPVRNRPDEFFHSKPSGFRVCPMGSAGCTSLLLAQKIAAVGEAARGRKIAVILSGSWFCRPGVPDDSYAGNFSPLQASSLLLGGGLDEELRLRFTRRMSEFPDTFVSRPVLGACLSHAEAPGAWAAMERWTRRAELRLYLAQLTLADRSATVTVALNFDSVRPPNAGTPASGADYERLIADIERAEIPEPDRDLKTGPWDDDAAFIAAMNASREWDDFALLLDTLVHLEMRVLILCVPLHGRHYDEHGISHEAREHFYRRLESACAARGASCAHFSDHERDESFTLPGTSHFTEKGWIYADRVLDDFYHDRLPAPRAAPDPR